MVPNVGVPWMEAHGILWKCHLGAELPQNHQKSPHRKRTLLEPEIGNPGTGPVVL